MTLLDRARTDPSYLLHPQLCPRCVLREIDRGADFCAHCAAALVEAAAADDGVGLATLDRARLLRDMATARQRRWRQRRAAERALVLRPYGTRCA